MSDPEQVFSKMNITEQQKKILQDQIANKMAPAPVKLRADFELTCLTYEGIDGIKEALMLAKQHVNDETF
jgi:translation initiation factor 2 subunit 1